jgi:hypothetical protein
VHQVAGLAVDAAEPAIRSYLDAVDDHVLARVTGHLVQGVRPYQDAGMAMTDLVHMARSMSGVRERALVLRTGAEALPKEIGVSDPKLVSQVVPYAADHLQELVLVPRQQAGLNMLHRLARSSIDGGDGDTPYARLKVLTVTGVRHLNNPALVQRLARRLVALERLQVAFIERVPAKGIGSSLCGGDDDAALASLARAFPKLQRLAIGGARLRIRHSSYNDGACGSELLEAISSLQGLEELSLPGAMAACSFSSGPAHMLCALGSSPCRSTLKRLNLHDNNINSTQAMLISANLPNLEQLDISGHRSSTARKLQSGAIWHLATDLTRLTGLSINNAWDPLLQPPGGGSLAEFLAPAADRLVLLGVAGCMLTGADAARVVEALPLLRALDVSCSPPGIVFAPGTTRVAWDTTSVLYGREDRDMTWLAPLTQLTRLGLASTMATADQARTVATRLARLRSLDLSYNIGVDASVLAEVRRLLPAAEVVI